MKEAKDAWHKFVDGFPTQEHLSTKYLYYFFPFKDHKVFDRFIDGLNTAGFEGNPSDYYRVDKKNRLSGQKIKEFKIDGVSNEPIELQTYFLQLQDEAVSIERYRRVVSTDNPGTEHERHPTGSL